MKTYLSLLLALFVSLAASVANAEQKTRLGPWEVHYMALNSTFLTPDVAKAYGITRSRNNALINISILDNRTHAAQAVDIRGSARNLLGSEKSLDFQEVKEGEAIYYLAVLPFSNKEHYRFNINIQQGTNQQTLKFEQMLYQD